MVFSWALLRREMSLEARRPANYRLRFLLGAVATGVLCYALLTSSGQSSGRTAFYFLHNCLVALILVCGPALAADSLSKEKREGTLGLLFLTPLTARQIVSGKFLVHLVRLGGFWAVAVPLVAVPLLQGGVSSPELVVSFLFQMIAILLVLAASILASTGGKRWIISLVNGYVFSVALLKLFFGGLALLSLAVHQYLNPAQRLTEFWTFTTMVSVFFIGAGYILTGTQNVWAELYTSPRSSWAVEWTLVTAGLVALAAAWFLLRYSARRLKRFAEQEIETKRQAWFRRVFLTPLYWRDRFRQSMRRNLDRNPFIWLEYRTAWSRAGRWLMVFVLILVETWMVAFQARLFDNDFLGAQLLFLYLLGGILAFTAASSFQKERECGAFELLLVTPLQVTEIIWGRVRAVWRYYTPVILTLLVFMLLPAFWGLDSTYRSYTRENEEHFYIMGFVSLVTLPFLGLQFALRFKNFLAVLIPTLCIGLIAPAILEDFFEFFGSVAYELSPFFGWLQPDRFSVIKAGLVMHLLIIAYSYVEIHNRLTSRKAIS